jgi:hypothetical protein
MGITERRVICWHHSLSRHAELVSASIKVAISGGRVADLGIISAPDGASMDAETRSA